MIKHKLPFNFAASLIASLAIISGAKAQLIGSTVDVVAYYPDTNSVYADPGNRVVSAALEYPSGSYSSYNSTWQIDITNSQMIITNAQGAGFPYGNASFNGFILQMISGPTIVNATVDPASGFSPVSLTVLGGNKVLANFAGVNSDGSIMSSIININVVPEPSTLALAAMAGLLITARRQRTR